MRMDVPSALAAFLLGAAAPILTTHANRSAVVRSLAARRGSFIKASAFAAKVALGEAPFYIAFGLISQQLKQVTDLLLATLNSLLGMLIALSISSSMLLYGSAKSGVFTGFVAVRAISLKNEDVAGASALKMGMITSILPNYPTMTAFMLASTVAKVDGIVFFLLSWSGSAAALILLSIFVVDGARRGVRELSIENFIRLSSLFMMTAGFLVYFIAYEFFRF